MRDDEWRFMSCGSVKQRYPPTDISEQEARGKASSVPATQEGEGKTDTP